jgi:hypothetical protein
MEKPKMNLKMFEKEKLQIAQLLEAKGGSGSSNSSCNRTRSVSDDSDCPPCDCG